MIRIAELRNVALLLGTVLLASASLTFSQEASTDSVFRVMKETFLLDAPTNEGHRLKVLRTGTEVLLLARTNKTMWRVLFNDLAGYVPRKNLKYLPLVSAEDLRGWDKKDLGSNKYL